MFPGRIWLLVLLKTETCVLWEAHTPVFAPSQGAGVQPSCVLQELQRDVPVAQRATSGAADSQDYHDKGLRSNVA